MGKRIIIPGADFSANGIRTNNVVYTEVDAESTIPYKFYFLPTAKTQDEGISELPVLPSDAIEKTAIADSETPINGNYVSLWFGRHDGSDPAVQNIKSISVNYNRQISDMRNAFMYLKVKEVDLSGMSFADGLAAYKMFAGACAETFKLPNLSVTNSPAMFYNFNFDFVSEKRHTDFTFIKKMAGNMTSCFQYLKSGSGDFSGIDVKDVTAANSMFSNCLLSEIDLSTWEINSLTHGISMFEGCANLKTIHLDKFNCTPSYYSNMFNNTPLLEKVFVTNCTSTIKTWLLARLNEVSAGGSNAWSETTVDGKACLTHS